jgi:hypothetical protein
MANAAKGGKTTLFGERGLGELLTSVDDLGDGLGVALTGSARDRVVMKRGNNLGFRGGLDQWRRWRADRRCAARCAGAPL